MGRMNPISHWPIARPRRAILLAPLLSLFLCNLTGCASGGDVHAKRIEDENLSQSLRQGLGAALNQGAMSNATRRGCLNSMKADIDLHTRNDVRLAEEHQRYAVFFFGSDYISLRSVFVERDNSRISGIYKDFDSSYQISLTAEEFSTLKKLIDDVMHAQRNEIGVGNDSGLHESCVVFYSEGSNNGPFAVFSSNELDGQAKQASAAYEYIQTLIDRAIK